MKLGYLQEVSTDHCPFNFKGQKELGRESFTKIPNGGPGVEDRLSMVYQGGVIERGFTLNKWVDLTSTASAKMFGMFPKKGTIAVGSDADIVIFDPDKERTISAEDASHELRLQLVRRMKDQRRAADRPEPRQRRSSKTTSTSANRAMANF